MPTLLVMTQMMKLISRTLVMSLENGVDDSHVESNSGGANENGFVGNGTVPQR